MKLNKPEIGRTLHAKFNDEGRETGMSPGYVLVERTKQAIYGVTKWDEQRVFISMDEIERLASIIQQRKEKSTA